MPFALSTAYERWVTNLRLSWMGASGRAIMGALAAVIGDKTVDWATQAVFEHLPQYASAPSVALTAADRLIDAGPGESTGSLATRLMYASTLWRFANRPLGLLLALHYQGFDNAVIIQQNGRAFSLTLPLPDIGPNWDSTPNQVVTACNALATALTPVSPGTKTIPAGTPWCAFDSDTDFCSRFAILFPGPLPSDFTTFGTATFTGAEDAVPVTWNNAFDDTGYHVLVGPPTVTDSAGPVLVDADGTTKTTTGVQVRTSERFAGTVDVLAWRDGQNPFCDLHPGDLARLQRAVAKWRPKKATCVGVYAVAQGKFWGWPPGPWAGSSSSWGPSSIVTLPGPWS